MVNISVQELALQAVSTMIKEGYKPITAWYQYENNLIPIIKLHEQRKLGSLDEDTVLLYSKDAKERYECGEISYSHFRFLVMLQNVSLNILKQEAGISVSPVLNQT